MGNKLLTGIWRTLIGVPPFLWERQIEKSKIKVKQARQFMTPDHCRVHHFVVRELPRFGKPLPAEKVAGDLALSPERTEAVLKDLEQHLTFLVRDEQGQIVWAYPVTVEETPHRITFSSGEKLYAA